MAEETRALVADILSELITYIRTGRPTRTNGSSTQGYVYSQLRVGQMISPRDFGMPWSPIGGAAGIAEGQTAAAISEAAKRAYQASFNTTQLVDTMMIVTNDGTMETYSGGGRHLATAYEQLVWSMQSTVQPTPPTEEEQARLNEATATLYSEPFVETEAYLRYLDNRDDFAQQRANYTTELIRLQSDPLQAGSIGTLMRPAKAKLDRAYDRWKSQGADKIEAALAVVSSQGRPLEEGMIEKAKEIFTTWSVLYGDVGAETPYSYVLPSEWALIGTDDIGWTSLRKDSRTTHLFQSQHGSSINAGEWHADASQSSGSAGVGIFGFGFSGGYSESESNYSHDYSQNSTNGETISDDATELTVEMEYGLVQIVRPWLLTDIFHLKDWKMPGKEAGFVSDGTISGQVGNPDKFLPLVPTHFLCIRNVRIHASNWGSVRNTLENVWGRQRGTSGYDASSWSGGVNIPVFGIFNVSASASHSESSSDSEFTDTSGRTYSNDYGARFEGEWLEIKGTQIVAWLSEVVPLAPPQSGT